MASTPTYSWPTPDNTDLVKNGALAIRTLGNAIDSTTATMTPKSIVDAKGDLIAASANDTPARLAVGANGETLVADSSTTTGLRYTALFGANKNKIINGDFGINQRAFTSNTTTNTYGFDRWKQFNVGGSFTTSPQTFTAGAAPVAGYEATNFLRGITATQSAAGDYATFDQPIEDVRTFANQTVTVSFWAKAASGTPKIAAEVFQNFGSGGSGSVSTPVGSVTISTGWVRYSLSILVPTISGKTIGTGSSVEIFLWVSAGATFATRASSIGIQNNTFDIWGVQVEAGSVATAFQTASGSIAGELALAQRYYYRMSNAIAYEPFGAGYGVSATRANAQIKYPVPLRATPTSIDYANLGLYDGGTTTAVTVLATDTGISKDLARLAVTTASGITQYRPYELLSNNSTSAYVGFNAEL
jgi:hypothetical protein